MDDDVKFANGMMVKTEASVKMKNCKSMMRKDSDCMYMMVKMTHMPMKKRMGDAKMHTFLQQTL
ncbi:MAG: hypothetical protein ABIN89_26605 [Chitinophagaceae bacterium]